MSDTISTQDIAALIAAIDQGDDVALLALADALEEAGDPRAAGIRLIGSGRPRNTGSCSQGWAWEVPGTSQEHLDALADLATSRRQAMSPEERAWDNATGRWRYAVWRWPDGRASRVAWDRHGGRATAFLAMAEALTVLVPVKVMAPPPSA